MSESLDDLVRRFFAAFDNRAGTVVNLNAIRGCFAQGAIVFRSSAGSRETMTVDQFIEPRQALLTNGSLVDFHEWEVEASTFLYGEIACRTLRYRKEGMLNGAPLSGEGRKSIHLVRIDGHWRITSIIWQDSDAALPIDSVVVR